MLGAAERLGRGQPSNTVIFPMPGFITGQRHLAIGQAAHARDWPYLFPGAGLKLLGSSGGLELI